MMGSRPSNGGNTGSAAGSLTETAFVVHVIHKNSVACLAIYTRMRTYAHTPQHTRTCLEMLTPNNYYPTTLRPMNPLPCIIPHEPTPLRHIRIFGEPSNNLTYKGRVATLHIYFN